MKEAFSKASDEKPLFSLKIKIKQNPGCPNKKYNEIFEHFHRFHYIPRSKKNLHRSMIGEILLHIGKNSSKTKH